MDVGRFDLVSTKFDGKNFALWKFQFRNLVEGKRLLPILNGTSPKSADTAPEKEKADWATTNAQVVSMLASSVDVPTALGLHQFTTAHAMWTHIFKTYSQANASRQFDLEFVLAKLVQGDLDIRCHYQESLNLWTEYDPLMAYLSPEATTAQVLKERSHSRLMRFIIKLKPEFEFIRASLIHRGVSEFDEVLGKLLREETRKLFKRRIPVQGKGMIDDSSVKLSDALYVPALVPNLVSAGQLANNNCTVVFNADGCTMQDRTTGTVIGQGHKSGRVFLLDDFRGDAGKLGTKTAAGGGPEGSETTIDETSPPHTPSIHTGLSSSTSSSSAQPSSTPSGLSSPSTNANTSGPSTSFSVASSSDSSADGHEMELLAASPLPLPRQSDRVNKGAPPLRLLDYVGYSAEGPLSLQLFFQVRLPGVFAEVEGAPALLGLSMVQFALSESLAPNVRLVSAANGAAVVSLLPHRIRYRIDARRWLTPSFPSPSSCRIRKFHSRCSNVNSDVQFNHAVADDEFFPSEGSLIKGDFLAPVVQHNTEILETPSFGLLVLSEEEQNALAATPAHPAGLYDVVVLSPAFYANVVTGNVVERLWEFTWPSTIALLFPSLLPVAVMGFFAKSTLLVGGPLLGNFLDYYPRVPAYISLNVIQAAAPVLSAMMIIHDHTVATTSSSSVVLGPWFVVLVLAGSIEKLCGVPLGIANERDWVVHLAGISKPIALAQANAVLSRIDMLAEIAGASMFGVLLSKYGPVTCLKFSYTLMIGSLLVMWINVWKSSSLAGRNIFSSQFSLLALRVSPSTIGGFTGLCAAMGLVATFLAANFVKRLGIVKAVAFGFIFQASFLLMVVTVYWSGSLSHQSPIIFFLGLIVSSSNHMFVVVYWVSNV
ncbi:unnamed protein product [Linum tenue]|uniref:Uncharacterized protein n=1 Tax=Linum tenue TaxID=586396 RepID=A0AAV0R3H5_9ROSI|nr:unnamed protein product [Linum tenue]